MEYTPPLNALPGDEEDDNRSYWDADPAGESVALRQGSFPSSIPFEAVQREVVNVIDEAGLTPDGGDLTQLYQAVQSLITAGLSGVGEGLYPVGSYYFNDSNSTNPATLLGFGTWVAVEDVMIMGASATYPAGSEGGSPTTTQTTAGLASHRHILKGSGSAASGSPLYMSNMNAGIDSTNRSFSEGADLEGDGDPMTTISPYRAAYTWRRTA